MFIDFKVIFIEHYLLQINLGSGTVSTISQIKYNDDKWHTIEGTRDNNDSLLKIDGTIVSEGNNKGTSTKLQVCEYLECYKKIKFVLKI